MPIVTSLVAIVTGIALCFVWPPIQEGLNSLSNFLLNKNLTLTTFIFGIIERSLIPFGLHHIFMHRSGSNLAITQTMQGNSFVVTNVFGWHN